MTVTSTVERTVYLPPDGRAETVIVRLRRCGCGGESVAVERRIADIATGITFDQVRALSLLEAHRESEVLT
jgi:hypothetical protein